MVEVNLLGAMAWMSQVAPMFQNAKRGQIVGVSSVAGDRGRIGNPGYNTSKAGLTTYLEAPRNRLTRHGVNVITIKPGMVKTEMLTLPGAPRPMFAVTPEQAASVRSRCAECPMALAMAPEMRRRWSSCARASTP